MRKLDTTEPAELGERDCKSCGKPHNSYTIVGREDYAPSWADPIDGHPYHPESWETIARRLMDEKASRDD